MSKATVEVHATREELFDASARRIVDAGNAAIAHHGRFSLVLTGGSTPKPLYQLLASDKFRNALDWSRVDFFWGDERFVPASDEQSNYRLAKLAMLDHLPLKAEQIHRVVTEDTTPEICANNYAADIQHYFGTPDGVFPAFDFVLNGLGSNRHTLSLFPHRPTIHVKDKLVVADFIPEVHMDRITMAAPLVNAAREVMFLVAGDDKAEAVADVLEGPYDPENKPAQIIQPTNGKLLWLLDSAAASKLKNKVV